MRKPLSDKFCASAKVVDGEVQSDYFDATKNAPKGLALRVGATQKTWMLRYSLPKSASRRWLKLGTYPATTLLAARQKAQDARSAIEAGQDPRAILTQPETLCAVCEEYIRREAGKLRTGAVTAQRMRRLICKSAIGPMPIRDLRRSDIIRWLDGICEATAKRGGSGTATAHQALGFLSVVCNWYERRNDDFTSPIRRGMSPHKLVARSRTLSDDEVRQLWSATADGAPFSRMVRFLLLSACRRDEARLLPWSELDGADWLLPAARNKTKLPLLRTLSPMALAQLNATTSPQDDPAAPSSFVPREAQSVANLPASFVFSPDAGASPLANMDWFKQQLDAASGVSEWTLHDLRRTARSLMSRAGVPTDHAERVLGHVIGGIRATYDRYEYREEKAAALAKLARLIDRIVQGKPTVVTLVRRE